MLHADNRIPSVERKETNQTPVKFALLTVEGTSTGSDRLFDGSIETYRISFLGVSTDGRNELRQY